MIELSITDILAVTGGRPTATVDPSQVISAVTTDSREVTTGALFVAKPGEFADGHAFVDSALAAGAVAALAERETFDENQAVHPAVIVPDAVEAMGQLAAHVVRYLKQRNNAVVVGITGSAGKTTTKDLLAALLATQGPTVSPIGSYNGEVGVPLTVFNATEQTKYLVLEMGATGIGHLTYLTDMVKPQLGVVLCVGSAHAGEFGGIENIEKAKGELVEALGQDGIALLNHDDARVARMSGRTTARIAYFGAAGDAPARAGVWATEVGTDVHGRVTMALRFPDGSMHRITSGLLGRHHATNILAAASAAYELGLDAARIAATLDGLGAGSRWRMERIERADGVTVINDAYNANPDSMRAALVTLAELGLPNEQGIARRTWAVLGAMLELGEDSVLEHDMLGRLAVRMNIKKLLVIGPEAKPAYNSAVLEGSWGDEAHYVPDLQAAAKLLDEQLQPGDIVLFKSSNGSGLRFLGDDIAARVQEGHTA